jgi:hypothetical protein
MNATTADVMSAVTHPYYPLGVEIPGFQENQTHFITLVTTFMSGWVAVLASVYLVSIRAAPNLSTLDRLAVMWFALCKSEKRTELSYRLKTLQVAVSISSSKATSRGTTSAWAQRRTCSDSSGRNIRSRTLGISHPTPSWSGWNPSRRSSGGLCRFCWST